MLGGRHLRILQDAQEAVGKVSFRWDQASAARTTGAAALSREAASRSSAKNATATYRCGLGRNAVLTAEALIVVRTR
jgi:hypothetical protein